MTDANKAVFLSYASQDAEAAKKICEALRAAGVEVWFDQNELVGGDAWDTKIRKQIKECALLIPVISANTQQRTEGYFRLEWRLADQRTHLMGRGRTFLLPVCIDETKDTDADVPDSFSAVQWTRLSGGENAAAFATRVKKLLDGGASSGETIRAQPASRELGPPATRTGSSKWWWALPVFGVTMALLLVMKESRKDPIPSAPAVPPPATAVPISEAQKLAARARALIDDDLMAVRENFRLADEFSRRAVALDATDGEAWATAARVSALMLQAKYEMTPERKETAKTQVERAGRLAPDSIETGLALATYLEVNNDPGEAERLLHRLIRQAPVDKRLWRSLATNLANNGRDEEALATLRQPAGLLEEDPQAQSLLAYVLSHLGRYREEEVVLERVLQRSPTKLAYYYQLVLAGFFRSDLAAASRALEKIPPQLMQEDSMINSAAEIWLRLGEGEKTLQVLQKSPRDFLEEGFEVRPKGFLTGAALQLLGRPTAAAAEWRQALLVVENRLAGSPNQPLLLYWKGVLQALTGQKAAAMETRKLYRELEARPNAWFDAILLVAVGENEQAIQGLEQAWPTAPVSMRGEIRGELLYGPWLAAIRADPRMQRLIAEQTAVIERDRAGPTATPAKADLSAVALAKVDDKSVAVLAFANLSDDKANEYFSDGISEELLNVLAKVPGLKVTARTSSFHFKGMNTAIPEIAQQLGVGYIVEGSVRKQGDKVRITAQLIKAADGFHVWSDTFTRDLKDIFAVQDEIAGLIANNLSLKMGVTAPRRAVDPEAYRLYLEALPALTLRTLEGFDRAEELINRAIERDPGLVPAQAALAVVWGLRAQEQQTISTDKPLINRIVAQAEKTLRQGPDWAEAQAACGYIYSLTFRLAEGEQLLRRAIQLNPSYAPAHLWLGRALLGLGRMDEALVALKHATELDPLSHRALDNYAFTLVDAGRPREALGLLEQALRIQPDSLQALAVKTRALADAGRLAEALTLLDKLPADMQGNEEYRIDVYGRANRRVELEAMLAAPPSPLAALDRFQVLLALGRYEEALAGLDQVTVDWGSVDSFLFYPTLDPLRRDPRFLAKLQASGLTEAHDRAQAWRKAHPAEKSEAAK